MAILGFKERMNAIKTDYAVTFPKQKLDSFQTAASMARDLIARHHAGNDRLDNGLGSLEKLTELRNKGIVTEEEFAAKKKQILGL